MGDMADFALDQMMDADEMYVSLGGFGFDHLSEYESEFLYDYDGTYHRPVFSSRATIHRKSSGPGPCPLCGGHTNEREGKFGSFVRVCQIPRVQGLTKHALKG